MNLPPAGEDPDRDPWDGLRRFADRRRDKVRAEIERNRRGEYTVPTWVFAVILAAMIAGCLAIYLL